MNGKHIRIAAIILTLLLVGLWGIRSAETPVSRDSGYRMLMGTLSRIVVVAPNDITAQDCLDAAFTAQHEVDRLMSYHKPDSELARLNRQADRSPIKVSDHTFTVLEEARRISALSAGAFDVTVAPLIDLWQHAADTNTPPSETEMVAAKAKVGWEHVILDPNQHTVHFTKPGMKIDLGGIAKGYAIDLSVTALKRHGALGGMIDIGGDLRCFGQPPRRKKAWTIGLQDPKRTDRFTPNQSVLALNITDQAVTTSGDYRRFGLIDGRKISHIIEPRQGRSSLSSASVTIIAPSAMTADALATAVSVMGPDQGLALIETLSETEAIVIANDGVTLTQTSGADKFILP